MSKEDEAALEQLRRYTVRIGNRFETSLWWKHPDIEIPDSLSMALFRAKCLRKKMQRDHDLAEILHYVQKGYIRCLRPLDSAVKKYWYLPYRVSVALNEDPLDELSLDLERELPTEKVLGM
nr:uncharacterized protein LOC118680009 [Bactrocera oleae]